MLKAWLGFSLERSKAIEMLKTRALVKGQLTSKAKQAETDLTTLEARRRDCKQK